MYNSKRFCCILYYILQSLFSDFFLRMWGDNILFSQNSLNVTNVVIDWWPPKIEAKPQKLKISPPQSKLQPYHKYMGRKPTMRKHSTFLNEYFYQIRFFFVARLRKTFISFTFSYSKLWVQIFYLVLSWNVTNSKIQVLMIQHHQTHTTHQ